MYTCMCVCVCVCIYIKLLCALGFSHIRSGRTPLIIENLYGERSGNRLAWLLFDGFGNRVGCNRNVFDPQQLQFG